MILDIPDNQLFCSNHIQQDVKRWVAAEIRYIKHATKKSPKLSSDNQVKEPNDNEQKELSELSIEEYEFLQNNQESIENLDEFTTFLDDFVDDNSEDLFKEPIDFKKKRKFRNLTKMKCQTMI